MTGDGKGEFNDLRNKLINTHKHTVWIAGGENGLNHRNI